MSLWSGVWSAYESGTGSVWKVEGWEGGREGRMGQRKGKGGMTERDVGRGGTEKGEGRSGREGGVGQRKGMGGVTDREVGDSDKNVKAT